MGVPRKSGGHGFKKALKSLYDYLDTSIHPKNGQVITNAGATPLTPTAASLVAFNDNTLKLTNSLAGAGTLNSNTAAALVAACPGVAINATVLLRIINKSGGAFAWTLTAQSGVTLTGTMSIAQNTWRDFLVTFTNVKSGTEAVTIEAVGTGTES